MQWHTVRSSGTSGFHTRLPEKPEFAFPPKCHKTTVIDSRQQNKQKRRPCAAWWEVQDCKILPKAIKRKSVVDRPGKPKNSFLVVVWQKRAHGNTLLYYYISISMIVLILFKHNKYISSFRETLVLCDELKRCTFNKFSCYFSQWAWLVVSDTVWWKCDSSKLCNIYFDCLYANWDF